eukprot:CAMPEP_0119128896 /NCGR_PEP_ID=MMETSP1310-20130426/6864_1 /TAXON_ID=464262 /ORGANISM="Genus nov. species nov., Strain RCC2339" /LENGTH=425 /DNA_ID=CAMNT_0007119275 /DNA_START=58 /DNA_END=1335 /DNA_ORIENTATION=-
MGNTISYCDPSVEEKKWEEEDAAAAKRQSERNTGSEVGKPCCQGKSKGKEEEKEQVGKGEGEEATMAGKSVASKKELLGVCKEACDVLSVFVRELYHSLSGDAGKLKEDKSVFTIADGIVQETLKTHLFGGGKFEAVVGEEDDASIQLDLAPYKVDDLVVPDKYNASIETVKERLASLGRTIDPAAFRDLTIFIDPIDGTREFYTKLGEQCTICIGFARGGLPVAGVVYRPVPNPATYALGCAEEKVAESVLDSTGEPPVRGLLTTNGSISPFISSLMAHLEYERVKSGGAGNKMLMVLEGKGSAYIQDRGVSRWDTCGAQAILEANGGVLAKLSAFAESGKLESYQYRESKANLDFVSGLSNITPYNSYKKDVPKGTKAVDLEDVKPYSNLCGLFAVNTTDPAVLETYHKAILAAKAENNLAFD